MTEEKRSLPKWILGVSAIFALLELVVSIAICVSPQSVVDNVDISARGVDYLLYMWAARQFALGFILAYATLKRSRPMLTLAYIFLLVMFVGDLAIGIWQGETSLVVAAVVMCTISAALIFAINRRHREAYSASTIQGT
jgi:hypothetical protein